MNDFHITFRGWDMNNFRTTQQSAMATKSIMDGLDELISIASKNEGNFFIVRAELPDLLKTAEKLCRLLLILTSDIDPPRTKPNNLRVVK